MRRHARLLVDYKGDELKGVRDFRKHVSWYLTGYPVGGVRRRALASSSTLAELDELLAPLDRSTPLPAGAERLARGHTQGPRMVTLPDGWRDSAGSLTPPGGRLRHRRLRPDHPWRSAMPSGPPAVKEITPLKVSVGCATAGSRCGASSS